MLVALEVRLRLRCPACAAHLLIDLEGACGATVVCGVCSRPATFDLDEARRRLAAIYTLIPRPDAQRDAAPGLP